MKILVIGAGGMAGHVIALRLAEKGHAVVGTSRRELAYCDTCIVDAFDTPALKAILQAGDFDGIINCVGILNRAVDKNPFEGIYLNACLPHLLAEMTRDLKAKVIHLSTDCVFSGHENGGYKEMDFCSADTAYGRSKALGELNDAKNLTFRTSIIGPDLNQNGIGLFHWFMGQTGPVQGYQTALWTGVTTLVLADAAEAALEQDLTGLYHLVNGEKINKYELLKLFNEMRRTPAVIEPIRPAAVDKSLVDSRGTFDFQVPSYPTMVCGLWRWIDQHRRYYPNYTIKAPPQDTAISNRRDTGGEA